MGSGWRIVKAKYADSVFSGEGARLYGGRWNSPGVPMVYLSEHRSLGALEIFVHTRPIPVSGHYKAFFAQWDDSLEETLRRESMPLFWMAEPPGDATMQIGDRWARERRSAVLSVPSVLVPEERNFALNPAHPDFRKITIQDRGEFPLDARLLGR